MQLITKAQAKTAGLRKYFTGMPCKRGHVVERFICGGCTECSALKSKAWYSHRERAAAKTKKWRNENSERSLVATQSWRDKNREKVREACRRHAAKNPAARKKSWKKWYDKNAEELRLKAIQYNRAHSNERRAYNFQYAKKNPQKIAAIARNRRARQRENGGSHTGNDVLNIFKMQRGKCAYCRVRLGKKYHVDHIIALACGGSNWPENLQILCAPCNQTKSAKDPIVFAQSLGMLL